MKFPCFLRPFSNRWFGFLFPLTLFGGQAADVDFQEALKKQGIDIGGSFNYNLDANFLGGIKRGVTNQWVLDLYMLFHSERIFNFPGGELFINLEAHEGKNPSFVLTGDLMIYDGLSAPNFIQLSEYWVKQSFGGFSCKVGRISASTDLGATHAAEYLMNNSFESIPTNPGFPSYPSPAPGILLKYVSTANWSLKLGVFDGYEAILSYHQIYSFGLWEQMFKNLLVQLEGDCNFLDGRGRVALGGTYNQAPNVLYQNSAIPIGFSGYLIGEYGFFDSFHSFLQLSMAETIAVLFPYYIGAGVKVDLPIIQDVESFLCLGVASGFYSKDLPGEPIFNLAETAIELTYRVMYKKIGIQPDLQYIINPMAQGVPNALGFILSIDITM